jgi:hypothetical protein
MTQINVACQTRVEAKTKSPPVSGEGLGFAASMAVEEDPARDRNPSMLLSPDPESSCILSTVADPIGQYRDMGES